MIHSFDVEIIEELDVPKKWGPYKYATVVVKYENGATIKVLMNEGLYKANKALKEFKDLLGRENFNKLADIIEEYGSDKYSEGMNEALDEG